MNLLVFAFPRDTSQQGDSSAATSNHSGFKTVVDNPARRTS